MDVHESLSHTKWDCKYHVVFIPKCRIKGKSAIHLARSYGERTGNFVGQQFLGPWILRVEPWGGTSR